jgi:hypothetical protein
MFRAGFRFTDILGGVQARIVTTHEP